MIKLVGVPTRKPGWSRKEFYDHYYGRHGPLSATVKEFGKYCSQYIQSYTTMADDEKPLFPNGSQRDGLTELWFDNVESLVKAYQEPDYMRILRTDEMRFVNLDAILVALCEEHELFRQQIEAPADKQWAHEPRHRLFVFRAARAGVGGREFQKRWLAAAPRIMDAAPFKTFVRRYVQSHVMDPVSILPGACEYDLIDEFWFDTGEEAVAFWRASLRSDDLAHLEAEMADPAHQELFFGPTHVVFGP